MHWLIKARFDRRFYSPGDQAYISIQFANTDFTPLYVSDMQVRFDYMSAYPLPTTANRKVQPQTSIFLGTYPVPLPRNIVGNRLM
jgi:hypothetical protein